MSSPDKKPIAWWNAAKDLKHDLVFQWVNYVAKQTQVQRMDTRIFASVCTNFNPTGNEEMDYAIRSAFKNKIRDNIVQAGVDTAVSMIALARTAPQWLTNAGEWSTSRKAEKMSRAIQGQFYDLGIFELFPKAFRQACEGGTGFVYTYMGPDGTPRVRRLLHNEVYVSPEDGRYAQPRMLAIKYFEDRDEIEAVHGKTKDMQWKISEAAGPSSQDHMDFFIRRDSRDDRVAVVEIWRLPTVEDGDDGVYIKALSNCTLVERPFKKRRHRVVPIRFAERDQGYYGQSLVERMLPAQMQLAETDAYISTTQKLGSVAKWFVDKASGITKDEITNAAVQIHEYVTGTAPPALVTSQATPPDLVQQRQSIKQDAYDAQGFGDNTVTGDVNKGLASGEAVQRADDVKVRRFLNPARLLEGGYLQQALVMCDVNDECAEANPEYTVKIRSRSGKRTWLKTTKWTECRLEKDEATPTMFPISAQATTAAAKWEQVDQWVQRGYVSKPMAMDLAGMPDTAAFEELDNADLDLVYEQLDNLIDVDDAREDMLLPVSFQDLAMAKYFIRKGRTMAWRLSAPDVVLDRFERYLNYLAELEAKAQPPAQNSLAPAALNPEAAAAAELAAAQAAPAPGAAPMMTAGPVGQA